MNVVSLWGCNSCVVCFVDNAYLFKTPDTYINRYRVSFMQYITYVLKGNERILGIKPLSFDVPVMGYISIGRY